MPRRQVAKIPLRDAIEADPVPIVADGAIATALWGEGRTIPVLILDTSTRPDVENLVKAQYWAQLVGDADSSWTIKKRRSRVPRPLLILKFTKPSHCLLIIEFHMPLHGVLVDQILWSGGLYLQPGRPGDRLATTFKNPRITVEVPPNEIFRDEFEKVHKNAIARHFRSEGMPRARAKQAASSYLSEHRGVFQRRIPFGRAQDTAPKSPGDTPDSQPS